MIIKSLITKEESKFIEDNYPQFGTKYCVEKLGIDHLEVIRCVNRNRLKRDMINKINIDLGNKYFCYVLGLLWSDGSISKDTNRVSISLLKEDIDDIRYIFDIIGKWNTTQSNNIKRGYRNQTRLDISDKKFKEFLVENNFLEKSFNTPSKIISKISKDNLKYFIRGISDGDGCFYYNKGQYIRQFCIASTYEQNWTSIEDVLNNIECSYMIKREIKIGSKSSIIRVTNKDILKIGRFIYDDFFGLNRKYDKFRIIEESYDQKNHKPRLGNRKKITIKNIEYKSMVEASISLNICVDTLSKRVKNGYYN